MDSPLTLAADPRAAQRARAFIAYELADVLVDDALDTAKLLVSELVTNSLTHAASAVQVECVSAASAVTVRVSDADTGPMVSGRVGPELAEGGRGLVLVEKLSEAWGTEHSGGRKTVWFRLGTTARPAPSDTTVPATAAGLADGSLLRSAERRLRALVLPTPIHRALTFQQQLRELVERVIDAVRASGAQVRTASGEDLVALGDPEQGLGFRVPVQFADRALGTLTVHLEDPDEEDLAFLRIAAERMSVLWYEHELVHAQGTQAKELDYLTDATELLAGTSTTRAALTLLTQIAVPRLGDWSAAYTVTDHHLDARRVTANHRLEERLDALVDLLDRDLELQRAVHEAVRTGNALRLPLTMTVAGQRTYIVVMPLVSRAHPLGVLVLGRAQPLDAVGFVHLLELGRRATLAIDNARMHEEHTETAAALQAALLPPALGQVEWLEFAARYHSASPRLLVGGDFYDAFQLGDGSILCSIGDVCGKGAEAAAVTGMSRDLIRLLLRDGRSLVATLQRLNRALIEDGGSSRFCTVALARLTHVGRELRVHVCLAGHPKPVVIRADGTTEAIGTHGDLLGVIPGDIHVTEVSTRLEPRDSLVLYTDGIIERRDTTRMFGEDGLRRTLQRLGGASAASVAQEVETAAQSFVDAELRDDLALLVAHRTALR
jgi:anti-sigma regulatory factor (Ser/Thr protein kinase)